MELSDITRFVTEITAFLVAVTALVGAAKALFDRFRADKTPDKSKRKEQMVSDGISSGYLVHGGEAARGKGYVALDAPDDDVVFKVSTGKLLKKLVICIVVIVGAFVVALILDESSGNTDPLVFGLLGIICIAFFGSLILMLRLIYRGFWMMFLR